MSIGAVEEAITVTGASPVVDATSGGTVTSFTAETLELTPTSRNGIQGLLAQAPGVRGFLDVGGNSMNAIASFDTFGQVGEPWLVLEGVSTTALLPSGGNGNYWDYLSVDEASAQTVGAGAEGQSRGVQMSAIVKSGGNQFHGGGGFSAAGKALQSNNIDDNLRKQGITTVLGDPGHPDTLRAAGLAEARIIVITVASLPDKMRICIAARELNPRIAIVATAAGSTDRAWLHEFGVAYICDALDEMTDALLRSIRSGL
jgi:hypothetical protein